MLRAARFVILLSTMASIVACGGANDASEAAKTRQETHALAPGTWLGELETRHGSLPFNMEFTVENGVWRAAILNGDEWVEVPEVSVASGEVTLAFPHYDSTIRATLGGDGTTMQGVWSKARSGASMAQVPFRARAGEFPRFDPDRDASTQATSRTARDFARRLRIRFADSEDDAVGVFALRDGPGETNLQGTILTTTGDYRYLSGRADAGSFRLSCFDGAHAFLFEATVSEDGGALEGRFESGNWYEVAFRAVPDEHASLEDPLALTTWREDADLGAIVFRDLDGNPVRLTREYLGEGPVLIEVMGTWCPNCNDAGPFLQEIAERYASRGLRVIALAFELSDDFERSRRQVERYMDRHQITYPVLIAGLSDKEKAGAFFPVLDRVRSYPTTIFLDADGYVHGIYTGFSGPATGDAHDRLRTTFERLIEEMLQ